MSIQLNFFCYGPDHLAIGQSMLSCLPPLMCYPERASRSGMTATLLQRPEQFDPSVLPESVVLLPTHCDPVIRQVREDLIVIDIRECGAIQYSASRDLGNGMLSAGRLWCPDADTHNVRKGLQRVFRHIRKIGKHAEHNRAFRLLPAADEYARSLKYWVYIRSRE